MKIKKLTGVTLVITAILSIAIIVAGVFIIKNAITNNLNKNNKTTAVSTTSSTKKEIVTVKMEDISSPVYKQQFGTIKCDAIGIDVPLIWGDDDECLNYGAGQDMDTRLPGSPTPCLIGGHCQTVFEPLQNAKVGDKWVITTSYGTYTYNVEKIEIININTFDYSVLEGVEYQALIYTCYPFGKVNYVKTDRMMLFCTLEDGPLLFS